VHFNPQNTRELLDRQVERLSVDSQGVMWIATTDQSITAMRDGRFELFRRPRLQTELRIAGVLRADAAGAVFNTETGDIARLDTAKGQQGWNVFKPASASKAFSYNIYPSKTFHCDRAGDYWHIDQHRRLARASAEGIPAELPGGLRPAGTKVNAIETDANGRLWIVTDTQILSWNGQTATDHTPEGTDDLHEVRQIAFSGDDGVWIAENQRLRKLAGKSWVAEADPRLLNETMSSRHYQLYGDSRGGAWIVSYGHGLLHARADGGTRLLAEQDGLPSKLLTCWFEDTEGNIWIGTTGDGLTRIRKRAFHRIGQAEGMPEKAVCSVGVDARGEIWAGTISGRLTHWSNGRGRVLALPPVDTTPLGGIAVWPSRSGDVWAGSLYHGLVRYRDGRLVQQIPMRDALFIRVFFEDSRGDLWIGQFGGMCRHRKGTVEYFGKEQGFQPDTGVGAFAEDADGTLWIGVETGDLWRHKDGVFTCHPRPKDWPRARCVSLQTDDNGVVWMGTLGNGLVRFQDGKFTRFDTRNGLPGDNVSQLLDDKAGCLWAGTYSGIFRVRKTALDDYEKGRTATLICTTYGREDGLPALECTAGFSPACWRAGNGRLLFTTVNGLVVVNPSDVTPDLHPPGVIIEELHVDGKLHALTAARAHSHAHSHEHPPVEIAPGKHFLQFRYTGFSYSAPEKVRFLWNIDGINHGWQDAGAQRSIGIGPLAPGRYRLRVRAMNSDGVWNENGNALAFRVLPWFWETVWFKTIAGITALAGITLVVAQAQRQRYRRRLREIERQRQLDQERTRIARDLHDDLGTSLMQISLLSTLANGPKTSPSEKEEIITRVDNRAREMITALDEIVWTVNPKNDTWYELANYLGFFAEEFFRPTGIRCRMGMPAQTPQTLLSSETRHHLFLAFKEAINNVAKHSCAGQVWVRIETDENEVRVIVEDDGRGFGQNAGSGVPSRPAGGNGLGNMRRRMEQIGGVVEMSSGMSSGSENRGAKVTFRVPLGKDGESPK
jgi:signal transduction histidine kinase/ligand-binding sensor domain-containing protein